MHGISSFDRDKWHRCVPMITILTFATFGRVHNSYILEMDTQKNLPFRNICLKI